METTTKMLSKTGEGTQEEFFRGDQEAGEDQTETRKKCFLKKGETGEVIQ